MKITLTQSRLAKALNYVSRAVSSKPNIPVLSNVLLEVNSSNLGLSATNLDMGIQMWIGGEVNTTGKVTVSGKFLADFVSAAGNGNALLELKGDTLHVEVGKAKADYQTISAEEFPVLPQVEGQPRFVVESKVLIQALSQTLFATSSDISTSQIQFTGVQFSLSQGSNSALTLAGLDGYRLSENKVQVERHVNDELSIIVPARPLQEMVKILGSEGSEQVEVYLSQSKSQIIFRFDDIEFSIRLLEGPFPDYKQIMPQTSSFEFNVEKSELEKALKIVNTFARNIQGYRVEWDLDVETSTLLMSSKVPDLGVNEVRIEVQGVTAANDLKNAFNLMYLLDLVNNFPGDNIHFESNSPLEPAVFTSKQAKGFVHLVMPLQRD